MKSLLKLISLPDLCNISSYLIHAFYKKKRQFLQEEAHL